jgi:16S rRNA U516 pseudouridylate synthase RsuA-like enzyme
MATRLNKYISESGVSRSRSRPAIEQGNVTVTRAPALAAQVTSRDRVVV